MASIELKRICPICGCKYGECIHEIRMALPDDYPIPGEYCIVACKNCGFTFADVNATQDDYNKYYTGCNMYSESSALKSEISNSSNSIYNIRIRMISKYINKDMQLLDVGFGGGEFLKQLRKQGMPHLFGIDPSEESVKKLMQDCPEIACRKRNLFEEAPHDWENKFDIVSCMAVQEHIYDLQNFVKCLDQYVKCGSGMIYVDVPNVLGYSKYLRNIPNYFNHEHINHFSLMTLDMYFGKNGYERVNSDEEAAAVVGDNFPESGLFGLYRKTNKKTEVEVKDMESQRSIQEYFIAMQPKVTEMQKKVEAFIKSRTQIAVWGAGSYAMWLIASIPGLDTKIKCLIDNNTTKQGILIKGKKIISASELRSMQIDGMIICSMVSADAIVNQIKGMNIACDYMVV